jgi:hypothetical protein
MERAGLPTLESNPIISIFAENAPNYKLIAVTENGCRLYFNEGLDLKHARLPITNSQRISSAFCAEGAFLAFDQKPGAGDDGGELLGYSLNLARREARRVGFDNTPPEVCQHHKIPGFGLAWEIAENPEAQRVRSSNELFTQHLQRHREFLCLTNKKLHWIVKTLPVDELRDIINHSTKKMDDLAEFWKHYGNEEACAMALILVCEYPGQSQDTAHETARQLILSSDFGGFPKTEVLKAGDARREVSGMGSTVHGMAGEIKFSGRHNGILKYFTRFLYPFYSKECFEKLENFNNYKVRFSLPSLSEAEYSLSQLIRITQDYYAHFDQLVSVKDGEVRRAEQRSLMGNRETDSQLCLG